MLLRWAAAKFSAKASKESRWASAISRAVRAVLSMFLAVASTLYLHGCKCLPLYSYHTYIRCQSPRLRLFLLPLCTRVRGETVWKIAEGPGSSTSAAPSGCSESFRPLSEAFGTPVSGPILIFQTVSEGLFSEVRSQKWPPGIFTHCAKMIASRLRPAFSEGG